MSSYNFYSSGHQATIPSIRFEAAFVGLPGDMDSLYLPGSSNFKKNVRFFPKVYLGYVSDSFTSHMQPLPKYTSYFRITTCSG